MTRGEIEEFSGVELNCFETDREEDWYRIGCIDGLDAADAEPNLENLWHNVSEEPELNRWFIAQIGDNAFDTFISSIQGKRMSNWLAGCNIKRWSYIDDLLPKGG